MSNNGAFESNGSKTEEEDASGEKLRKAEEQPQKLEEENMKTDLVERLDHTLKTSKMFLNCGSDPFGLSVLKGLLFHGKPDLGPRIEKYLKVHGKDIAPVFSRELLNLSPSRCDDTFTRAVCCHPSIVLLIGLEHADSDMEEMITRLIKENFESSFHVLVIGTTAMLAGVSEKLRKSFAVVDLQELADP